MKYSNALRALPLLLLLSPFVSAQSPVPVRVAEVQVAPMTDRVEALGTARAWEFVSVRANQTERVTGIHFESGQRVEAGALLVELNHAEQKAELAGARASLTRHLRDRERLEQLVARKLATQEQLDAASTLVQETRARVAMLEARIEERVIRAPFAGQLGLRQISLGSLVSPSEEIAILQDISRLKLDFTLPERHLPALSGGMSIEARSQAHPGRVFLGEVLVAEARVDPQTRAFTVRARIDNREGLLLPGMLLRVQLITNPRNALSIPEAALVPLANQQSVYVLEARDGGQVVRRQTVELGRRGEGRVEVISGLSPGERVVTRGTQYLQDGRAVTAQTEDRAAEVGQR